MAGRRDLFAGGFGGGWGRVWSWKSLRADTGVFFSPPYSDKEPHFQGEIRRSVNKQPQKEAKKSEVKRSKRNTVTKLSGFVTISLPPANEQRGGASRGAALYNTLLKQDSY